VDSTGKLGHYFTQPDSAAKGETDKLIVYKVYGAADAPTNAELRKQLEDGTIKAFVNIGPGAIDAREKSAAVLRTKNVNDFTATHSIETVYRNAVRQERLKAQGFDPALMARLQDIPDLETLRVSEGAKEAKDEGGTFIAGYLTGFIIYMSLLLYGQTIMRSVIEEKGTRIIEVLVSSIKPYDLLLGKVLGNAAAALLQVTVWAIIFGLLATVGVTAAQAYMGDSFHFSISPYLFIYFILYYLFGFLIYSTLYAAVGATVDQESDAQQASMPIMILVMIPIFSMMGVIQSPSSTTSVILSLIPFFSPILMMGRIFSETPPFWQIALSFVLMAATFFGVLWLAARVYRVGILMYGKRFTPKEIMRWLRYT
jgi:ABC-2 type transport system permease protein